MAVRISSQQTITDITDAYSVQLSLPAYTFPGDASGKATGGTCQTQVQAFCGSDTVAAAVDTSKVTAPTGITVASDADATAPTLTITATSAFGGSGTISIPVTVDGIVGFTLSMAVSVAQRGAQGTAGTSVKISSKEVAYQAASSGTTAPTGTWGTDVPTVGQGQYLWTRTTVRYSDGQSTVAYSVSRNAVNGSNGTSVSISGTSVTYQASASGTTAPTGTWGTSIPSVSQGQYLWTKTVVSYSDGKSTTSYAVSRNAVNGTNGKDALSMSITSSNGLVFKNANISTTLTAHVYRAGGELSDTDVAALGAIKWYKDGGSEPVATGKSISVKASDVTKTATYVAQLEG